MTYQQPEWVASLQQTLLDLDQKISDYAKSSPSSEDACSLLVEIHACKADLSVIYDSLSAVVSEIMANETEVMLEGGAKIEKRYSSKRTGWQHKDLASEVARKITNMAVDMDTGEIVMSQEDMIANVLDYVQPSYWRIKELQNIGINPDHFCEVGETKTSIIVRKGQS